MKSKLVITLLIFSLCLVALAIFLNRSNQVNRSGYQKWKETKALYLKDTEDINDEFQAITKSTQNSFRNLTPNSSNKVAKTKILESISRNQNKMRALISEFEKIHPPKALKNFHQLIIKKWQVTYEGISYTLKRQPKKLQKLASEAYITHQLLLEEELRLEKEHGANEFELSKLKLINLLIQRR
jgi:hypothetical protein